MKKLFETKLHERDATIADLKAKLAAASPAAA
jgi:exonuclease VII large subunit